MFAKLYSRITESSLMEEAVPVRYVFMTMLAIADPKGFVIGTDVAIARRLNVPLDTFTEAMVRLMAPDPNSNSREHAGRRVIRSEAERGYQIVNYLTYRNHRDENHRREYMQQYIAGYRAEGRDKARPVNSGKHGKPRLAQAEAEAEAEAEADKDVGQTEAPTESNAGERAAPRAAVAAPTANDSKWLQGLKSDPAYQGIDVDREHAKMLRWCQESRKQPTRRRFVNWLNRCERPLAASTSRQPDHSKGF